jgi:hypothetical protein
MGVSLITAFAVILIAGTIPLGILQPAWQTRVGNIILANSHFAGIGAVLILLAQALNPNSDELEKWVKRLRIWAAPVAIGFFLLIPLQTYNGYKLLSTAYGQDRQAVVQLQKTLAEIQASQNEDELRAALSKIPGSPVIGKFNVPLPRAKQDIAARFNAQIKKLENDVEERNASRWQTNLLGWTRNCLLSLGYGAGFAELAYLPNSRYSMLFSILRIMPWNRKLRSSSSYWR